MPSTHRRTTLKNRGQVSPVDWRKKKKARHRNRIQLGSIDPLVFCLPQEKAALTSTLPTEVRGRASNATSARAFLFSSKPYDASRKSRVVILLVLLSTHH